MAKRLPILAVLLCVTAFASNLRASPPDLGVVIQSASYDPVKHEITVRFYNSTRRDVTAFHFLLRTDYDDGTSNVQDVAPELASDPTYTGFFIRAGGTYDQKLLELPQQKQVARVTGLVDVVAYDDGTAEVENEAAFNRMVERRKAAAVAMEKISAIFKQSLSAGNPPQAALDELLKLNEIYVAQKHDAQAVDRGSEMSMEMGIELHLAIENIRRGSGTLRLDQFQEYIHSHNDRLAAMKVHSELRRIN